MYSDWATHSGQDLDAAKKYHESWLADGKAINELYIPGEKFLRPFNPDGKAKGK